MRKPAHPGEILRWHYLAPLCISADVLAKEIDVDASIIRDILDEKSAVDYDIAERLAAFFNTTPEMWVNLQLKYYEWWVADLVDDISAYQG